jgi:hypothetical protein
LKKKNNQPGRRIWDGKSSLKKINKILSQLRITKMDRKKILETGLVIETGLLAIFIVTAKPWIIPVTAAIGAIFIFIPPLARLIHVVWMSVAKVLGWIMPKLILSMIWFFIFTPLAFVYRLTGHDELQLKKTKNPQFSDCPKVYSRSDFEKPW